MRKYIQAIENSAKVRVTIANCHVKPSNMERSKPIIAAIDQITFMVRSALYVSEDDSFAITEIPPIPSKAAPIILKSTLCVLGIPNKDAIKLGVNRRGNPNK